jgi:hypothetical protein
MAGWVFLPDDGPRMHRTTRPASTLCGRQLDATTPVLQAPRRAFSICLGCRAAGAQYPIPQAGDAPESTPERPRRQRVVNGRTPGWVQLSQTAAGAAPTRSVHPGPGEADPGEDRCPRPGTGGRPCVPVRVDDPGRPVAADCWVGTTVSRAVVPNSRGNSRGNGIADPQPAAALVGITTVTATSTASPTAKPTPSGPKAAACSAGSPPRTPSPAWTASPTPPTKGGCRFVPSGSVLACWSSSPSGEREPRRHAGVVSELAGRFSRARRGRSAVARGSCPCLLRSG